MEFFYNFIANLRDSFFKTNNLLDLRAKLIASMIVVIKDDKPQLEQLLKNIIKDTYKSNFRRNLFLAVIKNYAKMAKNDVLGVDRLLNDIKKAIIKNPKYKSAINFAQLKKLILKKTINEGETEIEDYSQIRVLEFLKNEVIK